ncbi:translation protein SH3-like domain-containing protein [Mortierella sp. GBAus27b]|nr:translation protein SH3-like domain-containing protein [Mortierella sp. GBAus27b]
MGPSHLALCTAAAKPAYTAPASVSVPTQFKANTRGQGLMQLIGQEEVKRYGADGRSNLFNKSHQDCLRPGDVVHVETLNSMSTDKTTTFIGVLIAMDRRGLHSSFTVRNVILKVGVEMKYMLYSPLIKSVRVLKKGEGFRRAKLYYLRDNPGRAFRLEGLIKQDKSQAKATKA